MTTRSHNEEVRNVRKERTYYTLKDKILKVKNMKKAENTVFINKGSAGVDGVTVKEFRGNHKMNMLELRRQFIEDRYQHHLSYE